MIGAATALSGGLEGGMGGGQGWLGGGLGIVIGLGIGFAVIGVLALVAFLVVRARGDSYVESAYHHGKHSSGTCCH